ncbi:hypothetical protein RSOLAG1IB_08208 [Rhizoctonia solani AG-1 IB]|uniref:Uncharacterized protein n=1 Tax=Thanatephorus cucumeris (strain AG1-IB / isolate 7/3/14) TaxID=1108050 RepID=A0A0B7FH18_THACB|nr:hypothetical protein RSOLAG1IB_08208 [Rhizoctonia solani AG-1 IB]
MVQFPPVPCTIRQPEENLLTMQDGDSICIVPPTGVPGQQEWIIEQLSEDSIALRNLKHNKYAGITGEPTENAQIITVANPFEFKIEAVDGRHRYKLYVDSGDQKLYADFSWLRIYPPQCALIPQAFPAKPWEFGFTE